MNLAEILKRKWRCNGYEAEIVDVDIEGRIASVRFLEGTTATVFFYDLELIEESPGPASDDSLRQELDAISAGLGELKQTLSGDSGHAHASDLLRLRNSVATLLAAFRRYVLPA